MELAPQEKAWSTGLFDCFKDMNVCESLQKPAKLQSPALHSNQSESTSCLFFWCFPCVACTTAQKFGECLCLPLLDIISAAILSYLGCPFCAPAVGLSLRAAVRNKYGIPGTIGDDCPKATFCATCSWCQIAREIDIRSKPLTVISCQPVPVNPQLPVNSPPTIMTAPHAPFVTSPSYVTSSSTVITQY
ncbi:hypothetical protein JZ751_004561 [Albula glossodonta]|nr:hypothetical protein JZ751_004561 [Albula glossodonta]